MSITVDRNYNVSREVDVGFGGGSKKSSFIPVTITHSASRKKATPTQQPHQPLAALHTLQPAQQQVKKSEAEKTFDEIANSRGVADELEEMDDDDSALNDDNNGFDDDDDVGNDDTADFSPIDEDNDVFGNPDPPALRPTPPFKTIEEERYSLLFQLDRIKQRKPTLRIPSFGAHSDIMELRAAHGMVNKQIGLEQSIQFQKSLLRQFVYGVEFASTHVSSLELELEGWGEATNASIDSGNFDDVLEELAEKYSGSGKMAPELKLLYMIVSSAAIHHVTRRMTKQTNELTGVMMSIDKDEEGGGYEKARQEPPMPRSEIVFGAPSVKMAAPQALPKELEPIMLNAREKASDAVEEIEVATEEADEGSVAATEANDGDVASVADSDEAFDIVPLVSGSKRKRGSGGVTKTGKKVVVI